LTTDPDKDISARLTLTAADATLSPEARITMDKRHRERLTVEPGKRGGRPCIRGLRITVFDVLSYLAAGMSPSEILSDFPDLEAADIEASLAYAAEREQRSLLAS